MYLFFFYFPLLLSFETKYQQNYLLLLLYLHFHFLKNIFIVIKEKYLFLLFLFFCLFFLKKLKENVVKTVQNLQFATIRVIGVFPFCFLPIFLLLLLLLLFWYLRNTNFPFSYTNGVSAFLYVHRQAFSSYECVGMSVLVPCR